MIENTTSNTPDDTVKTMIQDFDKLDAKAKNDFLEEIKNRVKEKNNKK